MKKFETFWQDLLLELRNKKKIKNWTAKKGNYGEDFTAQATIKDKIMCSTIKGSKSYASRKDFELVYSNWEGYLSDRIKRKDLASSFVTKYTISIIHQLTK
jgi:hypothetical protein